MHRIRIALAGIALVITSPLLFAAPPLEALATSVNGEPVMASARELFESLNQRATLEVTSVPAGKVLIVEHSTVFLDTGVRQFDERPIRFTAILRGTTGTSTNQVRLGYMDENPNTSRGGRLFLYSDEVHLYFTEGPISCDANTDFAGTELFSGAIDCMVSGRLIDAP